MASDLLMTQSVIAGQALAAERADDRRVNTGDSSAVFSAPSSGDDPSQAISSEPTTVTIDRAIRAGREAQFERILREFIPKSLSFPGHLGVHVLKPPPGSRNYHVVLRFASRELLDRYRQWPEYLRFREAIEPLLERRDRVAELTGLESWFTPPEGYLQPLPKWKMALVTILAVWPVSLLLHLVVTPRLAGLPDWLSRLIVSALMVSLLTWVIMPRLTRLLANWLHPSAGVGQPA